VLAGSFVCRRTEEEEEEEEEANLCHCLNN
jgi:hypothetical protein